MKILFLAIMLMFSSSWSNQLDQAKEAFLKKDYKTALKTYKEIVKTDSLSPWTQYNLGTVHMHLNNWSQAEQALQKSIVLAKDSLLIRNSYYNLGNTNFRLGQSEQEPKAKISAWRKAIASYKKSLDYGEDFEKAKRNIEYVQIKLKEEIDKNKPKDGKGQPPEPDQKAKEALARALQLCKLELYRDANAILKKAISENPTAASFSSYVQRITDIIDISEGRKPQQKLDNSNQSKEEEIIL